MRILVATFCPGGVVNVTHYRAVIQTILLFKEELPQVEFVLSNISTSMNSYARNSFVSMVLNDPTLSHVLFIDGNIGFHPPLIVKMLALGRPVVGCVLPDRNFDYKRFHNSRFSIEDATVARAVVTDYVGGERAFVASDGEELQFVDGFVRVNYASAGLLLIRRDALQLMKEKFPELWLDDSGAHYRDSGLKGGVLQCFDSMQGPDGAFIRDDFAFCRRWTEGCGGEIWSCIEESVSCAGDEPFLGHYLLKMKQEGVIVLESSSAKAISASSSAASQESAPAA